MAQQSLQSLQSAYRKGRSTESALLRVQNDILRATDQKNGVILVLLDLSAAFDTLDHGIMLTRLHDRFGVTDTALQWIAAYLDSRTQSVSIGDVASTPTPLIYGVPQGSVLGPQFYCAYSSPIADIARLHGVDVHLYADDTQLYVSFDLKSDANQEISRIESCICDISSWMKSNKLKLNDSKTELLVLTSHRHVSSHSITDLQVGDSTVHVVKEARNLGVTFDSSLKLDRHITNVCRSSYFHLRKIQTIRKFLTKKSCEQLIHAFVSTRLDGCNSLLHGLPAASLHRLQLVT